jgi:hypothetical protein
LKDLIEKPPDFIPKFRPLENRPDLSGEALESFRETMFKLAKCQRAQGHESDAATTEKRIGKVGKRTDSVNNEGVDK